MDLTHMKNIILQNSMLQLKIHYFPILFLIIFLGINGIICSGNINLIFAQSEEDSRGEQKSGNNKDSITTIKVKMNKNNMDILNHDRMKVVGYLNGEGQTKYLDLKKELEKKVKNSTNENSLSLDLKFNKSNEISSVMVGDQYYVCAYVLDDSKNLQQGATTTDDPIPLFDCMEGDIGKSTNADTITLFPTMKKYGESKAFYAANSIAKDNKTTTNDDSKQQVKITINVPVHDAKDIDDMNVVAMIKGEYQIKTVNVQNELKKGGGKADNGRIPVSFAFERQTELGPIQPGDLFFGCVTSDEFPGKKSKCEKRMLKDLDETSKLCARKDSSC
jgi:hypothetical protein